LRKLVNALDSRFSRMFPLNNAQEIHLFELLCSAYVDARYKPSVRRGSPLRNSYIKVSEVQSNKASR
jgi:hypothetical protein